MFRERGREGERGGEKNLLDASPMLPDQGQMEPATQACVLTGNRNSDL